MVSFESDKSGDTEFIGILFRVDIAKMGFGSRAHPAPPHNYCPIKIVGMVRAFMHFVHDEYHE
jgi:hypothetical protein